MSLHQRTEDDYVLCEICKSPKKAINTAHVKKHGITTKDYRRIYPNSPMKPKNFREAQRRRRLEDWENPEYRERMIRFITSPEIKKRSLEAIQTPEYRERKSQIMLTFFENHPEIKEKISIFQKEFASTPKGKKDRIKAGRSHNGKGGHVTWERMNMGERVNKMVKMWKAINQRPTKPELEMIDLIRSFHLPLEYVGDQSFYIGTKNPDFIDTLGLKKAVEVFGDYWHSEGRQEGEEERKAQLAEYGWDCLVIWEHELREQPTKDIVSEVYNFLEV